MGRGPVIGAPAVSSVSAVPDADTTTKGVAKLGASGGSATFQRVEDVAALVAAILPDGNIEYGTGAPSSGTGQNGDSYIDTAASPPRLYGPKASGAWPGGYVTLGGGSGGGLTQRTSVKTAAYTAAAGDIVPVDTTSGSVTITLPSAPANGTMVAIKDVVLGAGNAVTVACGGSDVLNRTGGPTSYTMPLSSQGALLVYTSGIWTVISDDLPLSQLDLRYAVGDGRAVRSTAYAATVTPNADTTTVLNIGTLTGNITIANPTGTPIDGQLLRLRFAQDATGGRTVTFNSAFAFGTDITAALIPSAPSAQWVMLFTWDLLSSKWRALAIARGF